MEPVKPPKTLRQAVALFSDPGKALAYAIQRRWPDGRVLCPRCGHDQHSFLKTRRIWFCKGCKRQFTIKVGTIFEDSPIQIGRWMIAYWMLVNCKNGVSSYGIAKAIGVTQKSAWFMLHRLRLATQDTALGGGKLGGPGSRVGVGETLIGGRARNMQAAGRKAIGIVSGSYEGKTVVFGMLDCGGRPYRGRSRPRGQPALPLPRERAARGSKGDFR